MDKKSTNMIELLKEPYIHYSFDKSYFKTQEFIDILKDKKNGVFIIDVVNVKTKKVLLEKIAKAMLFPNYFSKNWDALEECINDLGWLPFKGYIIIFNNADLFLESSLQDFKILFEILINTATSHAKEKIPFHIIFTGSKNLKRKISELSQANDTSFNEIIE